MGDVEQRVLVHIPPTRKLAQGIFSAAMGAHLPTLVHASTIGGGQDHIRYALYAWCSLAERQGRAQVGALYVRDMLETSADSTSSVGITRSIVLVLTDSLVKFEGFGVDIEHGTVRVATSRGLAAKARAVAVKPFGSSRTVFNVTDWAIRL